ncbi:MAG: TIM barrel protein [Candidatus Pacearchaeota archaeon]|jgi:deoxyribonuclease-4
MDILFGPGGLGGVKEAIGNLEEYHKLGLRACEIEFVYGVYIKESETREIRETAEKLGIELSIHAHYWINLNSDDNKKVEQSKKRILECCKIGERLGVHRVVFHPGFYGKKSKEETYEKIKKEIIELQEEIKKNKWKIKLAPETTGKINVFGTVEEILNLVKDTGCSFTVDFAHLLARSNGKMSYEEMVEDFKDFKELHCHFSGINYGLKGEKNHIKTPRKDLEELIKLLKKSGKKIIIINESPEPVEDSVVGLGIWKKLN